MDTQVKHYTPAQKALDENKASEVLLKVFESTLNEFGLTPGDLASGTTDSGSDIKWVGTVGLLDTYGVLWDWCPCHLAVKAAEQAFGVSADPAKSKNPAARELLRHVTKVVEKLNKSPTLKSKFDDLQLEMVHDVFKIVKHAPQRWLSLTRTLERIIRLWYVLRKLYSDEGMVFPLDQGSNKDGILQLYSLMQPLSAITRDGQFAGVPMTAEIHMKFGFLKVHVLDPTKSLKVFDIPPIGEVVLDKPRAQKHKLPTTMVSPDALHPVAKTTRDELCKALVSRFYGRVWDPLTPDPSFFRDSAVLLTPPFNGGQYLDALKLREENSGSLPASSLASAPTSEADVAAKLESAWDGVKKHAIEAAGKQQTRAGTVDREGPFKRHRTSLAGGAGRRRRDEDDDTFSMFGRPGSAAAGAEGEEEDPVEQQISEELLRYQALFTHPDEVRNTNTWSQILNINMIHLLFETSVRFVQAVQIYGVFFS